MRSYKILSLLSLAAVAGVANADLINVNSTGVGFADGAVDSNWLIDGGTAKVSAANGAWTGGNAVLATGAKWINIDGDPNAVRPAGVNLFSTTFDLTGYDASTANLGVFWSSDNGSKLYLNGHYIDALPGGTDPTRSYQVNKSVNISSYFVSGVNTLSFEVTNGDDEIPTPGPIGLIADIHGTVNAVPEPTSMAALGLGGLALLRRRRKA
ncbi:hypothetical protein BH11ARM2_BH11ARM2_37110 [soil metagenome]